MSVPTPKTRIYRVVFNPEISINCKKFILNELPESYTNGDSYFYSISSVLEALKDKLNEVNDENNLEIKQDDIKELERLMENERVSAIELF